MPIVRFLEPFKDGTILPKAFRTNETADLTMEQILQIRRSGGFVEIIGAPKPEPEKKAKKDDD